MKCKTQPYHYTWLEFYDYFMGQPTWTKTFDLILGCNNQDLDDNMHLCFGSVLSNIETFVTLKTLKPEVGIVSQAGIGNCIPEDTVGSNYLSLPDKPASGTSVEIYSALFLQQR